MLLEFSRPPVAKRGISELTRRESEVLELLSQGLTNRAIGDRLYLAEKTVKHHMTNILQKLQVHTRTEAAIIALQQSAAETPAGKR
jgi:DNA-binding NarL/FixJ family response regulator